MPSKKHRHKTKNQSPVITILLGGLLIGLAVLLMASSGAAGDARPTSAVVPMPVNYPAPELALQNLKAETESLADYRGQVVLVNNWATWCPPCRAEMPVLSAYYERHRNAGFTIIAVEAGDPADAVSEFVRSLGLSFPVWLDPDGASLRAFGNGGLPNSYVIDRSGTVRYAWTGAIDVAMLEEYVTPLLGEDR